MEKTHFRKAFHSPYLGAVDIVEPIAVTIKQVRLEPDKSKQSRDSFNTAYFEEQFIRKGEPMKPMILNVTNCKFMVALTGSKFIDDWAGAVVEIYVDPDVRFGRDTVEGLRLRAAKPRPQASDTLVASAQAAAEKGSQAFAEWFNALTPEERKAIGRTRRDELMVVAKEADKQPPAGGDVGDKGDEQ